MISGDLMLAVKYVLIIGGVTLLIDGIASLIKFRDQSAFPQLVRIERSLFALLVVVIGFLL